MKDNSAHGYSEGSEETFISRDLLEWFKALSAKRHIEIVSLKEQLKRKDEEIQQLKEALKEMLHIVFEVRNTTNISIPSGRDKVTNLTSLVTKVTKLIA